MNYQKDVRKDAIDFIVDHEDEIKEAIKEGSDFDANDISCLDEDFHCDIIDRAYSPADAGYILENCENEEDDRGLWDGQDPKQAISTMAAFSYGNDVWFEAKEIYEKIKEKYDDTIDAATDINNELEEDEQEDEDNIKEHTINDAWNAFFEEERPPLIKDGEEEKAALERWIEMGSKAGLWGGYPLGSSYIDARCGAGYSMPDIKEYVDFDHVLRVRLPNMAGKHREDVQRRIKEIKALLKQS